MSLQQEGMQVVSLSLIKANPVSLRDVDRESDGYMSLVDSIRNQGFTSAIQVRPHFDYDEEGRVTEEYYELVDGLHRFTAAGDAGLTEVPVIIVNIDEDRLLEAQLMANACTVPTKPFQYAQQIRRLLDRNPTWTIAELATKIAKSVKWVEDILDLNKIKNPEVQKMVDEGKIKLSNAYELSRLPEDEQEDNVSDAITMPAQEFTQKCKARLKEIKDAHRAGKDAPAPTFIPTAFMRKMSDIKNEMETLQTIKSVLPDGITPEGAAQFTLQWVLNVDPATLAVREAEYNQRLQIRKEAAEKKSAGSQAKKTAQIQRKAEVAQREAEVLRQLAKGEITQAQADEMKKEIAVFAKSPLEIVPA